MDQTALSLAVALLEALPSLVSASAEVLALIQSTATSLKTMQADSRDPTPEEWAAMNGAIGNLLAQLQG